MAGETQITVIGNLTRDPELRFTPNGAAVANFTVASTPRTFDRASGEWRDGEAMFLDCSVWRQYAENVAESLHKGTRVIVTGRLSVRSYETNSGERRSDLVLNVDDIGPSLQFATAQVTKTGSAGGPGASRGQFSSQPSDPGMGVDDYNRGGGQSPWQDAGSWVGGQNAQEPF